MTENRRYEPPSSGYGWLKDLGVVECLVLGEVPDEDRDSIQAVAGDVRVTTSRIASRELHNGAYAFQRRGIWQSLIMSMGRPAAPAHAGRDRSIEDCDLTFAPEHFDSDWSRADPFAGSARFRQGDMVQSRGGGVIGRVRGFRLTAEHYQYDVDMQGEVKTYNEGSLVLVEGDPKDPAFWLSQQPARASHLALTLTWTKLRNALTDTLYSFGSSKTVFRAYQFKPVLKVLTGSTGRLLIADEVGLGKTIEAGLIWSELEQRHRLDRVLCVAPAVLSLKWKMEMERRFDRQLKIIRPADLSDFADRLRRGEDPKLHGVISLEALRGADKVLEQLAELHPRFDLVIVDEAHYLRNRESKSNALGRLLADWTDFLIFLSATPLNLGNDDLFNLINLLDEGQFGDRGVFDAQLEPNRILNEVAGALVDGGREKPRKLLTRLRELRAKQFGTMVTGRPDYKALCTLLDVGRPLRHDEVARARRLLAELNVLSGVLTRTRKAEVPDDKAIRVPCRIDVPWTDQERAYYESVKAWYMSRALEMNVPPGFATQMPLRQAASCIPASQQLMSERHPSAFLSEAADSEVEDFDEEGEADLSGLPRASSLTAPIPVDTKYEQVLAELLRLRGQGMRQVMIFSFFRRTLAYLESRLSSEFTVRVMHGGTNPAEREVIMREFRAGDFDMLLLSEVGSEGLDFEFCNVLVNYDLPWNPMRVEQRIGRLDRFGQKHEKIFIYNVHVPGTIETDIFQRLYDRIGVFRNSIGELEPILRSELAEITKNVLNPRLQPDEQRREIDRVAVAIEQRSHEIEKLRSAQAQLSGLDGLIVDGMTEHGPGNGRFIGTAEIRRLMDELVKRYGGRLGSPDPDGVFTVIGTPKLAERLRSSRVPEGGSRWSRSKLAALLQNGERLNCTVRTEVASRSDAELLSARHPLVKLALEVLEGENLALPRFGVLAVPGLPAGRRYLVTFDLASTTGLRPSLELWATAIDLDTYRADDNIGDQVLTALADGQLSDGMQQTPTNLMRLWNLAKDHLAQRHLAVENVRRQDNAALVEGRIQAREASLDLQIDKTAALLRQLRADGRKANILRLHESRLRNLRARRADIRLELGARKELDIGLTAVAVALIESEARTPYPYTSR
ncbi:DEAD/DEAH box helicase [Actinoplanes sp. NBC_00393]|uniref:helicase-related protein n=1 Tax=Actinoplanes sp. NBC_00393 TaxID=2975953 RepID=UPI002E1ED89F